MVDRVQVFVKVQGAASDEDDASVPGIYLLEVDSELDVPDRASAALDAFHESVGISTLDDFEITAFDADGTEIVQGEAESYTLGSRAEFQGVVDPSKAPAALQGAAPGL